MPGQTRSLPGRPSLRFLKLEAKRRLAGGEFPTLHDAQAAIAREHGLPSWAALKHVICGQPQQESHALSQLSWVIGRFADAGAPTWSAPGSHELRQHFGDAVLGETPAAELVAAIIRLAPLLREDFVVVAQTPLTASIQFADMQFDATVEAEPPHRLAKVRGAPPARRITDPRVASPPPTRSAGDVPAPAAEAARWAFAQLGLVGLALAGGSPGTPAWAAATGWADLDRGEALDVDHRFPAPGIAALATATAVLRLVADGRFGLDDPANDHLHTVRLADDAITVRELLSHTAGANNPAELFAESVPDLVALTGPVIACDGTRGVVRPSNGGYAALGQLIADVTRSTYAAAVTRLVLAPLGMSASSFPAGSADIGPAAVTGYKLTPEGAFAPVPARICTVPAVGGLWATAADIVRLGAGWSSLLPAALAREALRPQTSPGPAGHRVGLGWLISPGGDIAIHAGSGPADTATLLVTIPAGQVHLTMTNRLISLDPINARVLRLWHPSHSRRT
jgi:CubicO group peptidase (beta-lactamase class C family)